MRALTRTIIASLCLLMALGACKQSQEDESGSGQDPGVPEESAYEDGVLRKEYQGPGFGTKPVALPKEQGDNAVYFALKDVGVIRLDDGGFHRLTGLERGYFQSMWVGPDGAAYVAGWGIARLTADGAEMVASRKVTGESLLDDGAIGTKGRMVALDSAELYVNDGKKWRRFTEEEIGYGEGLMEDVIIDGAGNVWLLHSAGLWVLPAGQDKFVPVWDSLQLGKKGRQFYNALVLRDDGVLILVGSELAFYDGESLKIRELKGMYSVDDLLIGPDGNYFLDGFKDVTVVDPETLTPQAAFELGDKEGNIDAMTVDGQGRTWLATENGLLVLDTKMKATRFEPGSLPALSGDVQALVATGKGPSGMPQPGEVARGTIRGRLLKGTTPLSGITVEICPNPASMFHDTPCEDAAFKKTGVTGEDGSFSFEGVPLNAYGVAAQVGSEWTATMGSECSGMQEGDICDFGELVID